MWYNFQTSASSDRLKGGTPELDTYNLQIEIVKLMVSNSGEQTSAIAYPKIGCLHMRRILYRIISVLIIFFVIYRIKLNFFPLALDRLVQSLCLLIYVTHLLRRKLYRYELKMLKLLYTYCLIVISISILHLSFDFAWLPYTLNIILFMPIGYILSLLYNKYIHSSSVKQYTVVSFIFDSIIIANVIQLFFSYLFFTTPSLLDVYLSNVNLPDLAEERMHTIEIRMIGVGQAFFNGVLNYSFILTILILLPTLDYSIIYKRKFLYYIILLLTSIAAILTGRTSFITLSVLLIFALFYYKIKVSQILIALLSIFITFFFLYHYLLEFFDIKRLNKISNWALEMFNTGSSGLESTSSSTELLRMLNERIELKSFIIGDGYFLSNGGYYMETDVGYYRFLYLGGIIFIIFLIYYYTNLIKPFFINKIKPLILLSLLMAILYLIFNIKGVAMYDHFILLFIFPAYLYSYKSDKKQVL